MDGQHYDQDSVASPTVNIVSVRIIMVLYLLMQGYMHLVDVNGAFLLGGFEHNPIMYKKRQIFMEIPEGFGEFVAKMVENIEDYIMELLKTLHGTKQAVKQFWLFLLSVLYVMDYKYIRVNPCVYYKWTDKGLLIWASWVDDLLNVGPKKAKV